VVFPSASYLTATLGHNPSYVWRSIFRARFIVRGGARWSIGTGGDISILDEPWLLNGGRIDGTIEGAHFVRDFTVKSLLEENFKRWNEKLIRQVFSHDIASTIINTPLFSQVQQDRYYLESGKGWKVLGSECLQALC